MDERTIIYILIGAGVTLAGKIIFSWLKGSREGVHDKVGRIERKLERVRYQDVCKAMHRGVDDNFRNVNGKLDKIDTKLDKILLK